MDDRTFQTFVNNNNVRKSEIEELAKLVTALQEQNKKFETRIKALEDSKQSVQAVSGKSFKELEELTKRVKALEDRVNKLDLARKSLVKKNDNKHKVLIYYPDTSYSVMNKLYQNVFNAFQSWSTSLVHTEFTANKDDDDVECGIFLGFSSGARGDINPNELDSMNKNKKKKNVYICLVASHDKPIERPNEIDKSFQYFNLKTDESYTNVLDSRENKNTLSAIRSFIEND
jgi:polyhydroxyalkanoate synthesis regulator phasin